MTRQIRIEFEYAFYHIMSVGNTRSRIFKDDEGRKKFIEYLKKANQKFGIKIHAYCLMDNHYHLLIETPEPNLSKAMKFINGSYTNYYNYRHNRKGHLFAGRYRAILVDKDNYALRLSSYIHLNPVRAGIVKKPGKYPWSSFSYYLGSEEIPDFMEIGFILGYFGNDINRSMQKYAIYTKSQVSNKKDISEEIIDNIVIGKNKYLKWLKKNVLDKKLDKKQKESLKKLYCTKTLEDKIFDVVDAESQLTSKEKRKIKMYLLKKHTQMMLKDISYRFGDISLYGVSKIVKRFEKLIDDDDRMKRLVKIIENKLKVSNV